MGIPVTITSVPHHQCPEHTGFYLSAAVIHYLPSLRLVTTTSAGLNLIDLAGCWRRGISVAYTADIYSADVADLAVGLLLDVEENLCCEWICEKWALAGAGKLPSWQQANKRRNGTGEMQQWIEVFIQFTLGDSAGSSICEHENIV